jgi:hypothetical protein
MGGTDARPGVGKGRITKAVLAAGVPAVAQERRRRTSAVSLEPQG